MKRYIYSTVDIDTSMFEGTPFIPDTDTSDYNDFLDSKELLYKQTVKNRTGEIVMMSPNEYFHECSEHGFDSPVDLDHLLAGRKADVQSLNWLNAELSKGHKFYLPYINYADHRQEGLHRMMVVGDRYGWDTKFPVLVVTVYDEDVEHQNKVFSDYLYFRDHRFDEICENSAYEIISDWIAFPEDHFGEELLVDDLSTAIVNTAKANGYDIDVEIEIQEITDHHVLNIYIDRFEDYDSSGRYDGYKIIFEDYISPQSYNTNTSDPFSDDDILGLFFKDE